MPSPNNLFVYLLEGKVQILDKLEITVNVGQMWVIQTSIQKISDGCSKSFGKHIRWLIYWQSMRSVFTFYLNSCFQGEWCFTKKLQLISLSSARKTSPTSQYFKLFSHQCYLQNCRVITFEKISYEKWHT